ncbi:MAG: CDP-alcohol phosphatidyltransferase family protein [Dehalococcoidia bacterium]|nr:CDP-alcohol phosphatidyltransferase family protein [Dehalococcoidia bacterium]
MSNHNKRPRKNSRRPDTAHSILHWKNDNPAILSFMKDIPNTVTLLGLCSGVLGIYFALLENYQAAIIAMLWAVLFDWYDGPIARRIPERNNASKSFGIKMDSLADLISMAVCPAIILLSYGEFNAWFLPGALAIVAAGVIRLSYFDVFGVDDDGTIAGLSLDITALIIALVFLLEDILSHNTFVTLLYGIIVTLSFLHVGHFRTHKMGGRWYHVTTAYVLIMTAIYIFIL